MLAVNHNTKLRLYRVFIKFFIIELCKLNFNLKISLQSFDY